MTSHRSFQQAAELPDPPDDTGLDDLCDANGDQRKVLIARGRGLSLRRAVQEFLRVADEMLEPERRPPEAHGGCYMSRWRFERLRQALKAHAERNER
jgi:hypothetical protein